MEGIKKKKETYSAFAFKEDDLKGRISLGLIFILSSLYIYFL